MNYEKKTTSQLKKEADRVFSIYIRQRDNGRCISCGNVKEWKYQQNGHYVSRAHNTLRYDERNCNCQCAACNVFKYGAMDDYALALQRKYGAGILKKLAKEKWKTKQWTKKELIEIIKKYQLHE